MKRKTSSILSPEESLVILLTYIEPNENEISLIRSKLSKVLFWQEFFNIAQRNKVAPMVFYSLEKLGELSWLPEEVLKQFVLEKDKIKQQNNDRNQEAANFLRLFVEQGIPVALIKGVAFGHAVYHNPFYKRMNDIDILIHKKDIEKIYKIYDSLNYFYIAERIRGSREKSDKITFLAPPYISRDFKCVIGTQWGIKTPLGPYKINYNGIWSRMRTVQFNGIELSIMSPEDNLHHLCLHLGYFKIAIRDLMDFYNLIRSHRNDFDWQLFLDIVRESGSEKVAYHGLKVANCLCPMMEVESFIHILEPKVPGTYIRNTDKKVSDIHVLLNIFSDHIQTIEKSISEFNTTEYYKEKWRTYKKLWGHLLLPSKEEAIKMSLLMNPGKMRLFFARLCLPYRIFWVIAGDLSWLIIFFLIAQTFFDLVRSFIIAPFVKREKLIDSSAYAKNMGVSIEELKTLQEHFQ